MHMYTFIYTGLGGQRSGRGGGRSPVGTFGVREESFPDFRQLDCARRSLCTLFVTCILRLPCAVTIEGPGLS